MRKQFGHTLANGTFVEMSAVEYSEQYTFYSYPNCVLPLFGGIFLDKIGVRKGLLLFTTVLTLG